jgi:hypothetical protein
MNLLASMALMFALLQIPPQPPATFEGLFRGVESGHIVIEVDGGQNMRMFVTGSTKFIRDGKPSKVSQFHDGEPVLVEAQRDLRSNLVALRVEPQPPKKPKGQGDPEKLN